MLRSCKGRSSLWQVKTAAWQVMSAALLASFAMLRLALQNGDKFQRQDSIRGVVSSQGRYEGPRRKALKTECTADSPKQDSWAKNHDAHMDSCKSMHRMHAALYSCCSVMSPMHHARLCNQEPHSTQQVHTHLHTSTLIHSPVICLHTPHSKRKGKHCHYRFNMHLTGKQLSLALSCLPPNRQEC